MHSRSPTNPPFTRLLQESGGPDNPERLFSVGRLDVQSEGLLLLTNDGLLCHRLTDAAAAIPKWYLAVAHAFW